VSALKAIRPLRAAARMTRNMHVPAYDPAEVGLQLAEYRGVVWEFVKTISIAMDDEPIFSMMAGRSLSKGFSFAAVSEI
jgi:hypothetical protein